MTHQTGIQPNEELKRFLSQAKTCRKVRLFRVMIRDEELVLDEERQACGSLEDDYRQFTHLMVLDQQPCYLLIRTDSEKNEPFDWHLILWSPDNSSVREKMLYASTKATLKKEFPVRIDYFASCLDDLSYTQYSNFVDRKRKEENGEHDVNLLTIQEQDLRSVKREEAELSIRNANTKPTKTLPGVEFPLTPEATSALTDLKEGTISYLRLLIDVKDEIIRLDGKESHKEFDIKDLPMKVPNNSPRYHIFLFPHNHSGLYHKSTVFVHTVVGSDCSVRERMLYSSCKHALTSFLQKIGLTIDKKIESDDPTELTVDFLIEELHPKDNESDVKKKAFEKPAGPAGKRGLRRLIK